MSTATATRTAAAEQAEQGVVPAIPIRFSHVAFTVPRAAMSGENLKRTIAFFSEVFGFLERPQYTKDGEMLVMMAGAVDQFVVLFGHDNPATANKDRDHFGINVDSLAELQELLARSKKFAAAHPEADVEITDYCVTDPRVDVLPHKLHRFYVRFVTPCPLEVQYYERI
jgi:catechol 2,3-dioxygenase-like lactoylglutathione lyase family enzyme